ncbi:MAG: ABC transporter substrate-binding protein [Xanthobacteraceae bacterium]
MLATLSALPLDDTKGQTTDLDALYERAATEGEVSTYLQGPPQVYAGLVREFEAKYPKVRVQITPGRYDLVPKINEQIAAGSLQADLAILQTTQDYVRWKRQGVLQPFAPPGFDLVFAKLKDPTAHFLPVFLAMIGFAHNPTQVTQADAPRVLGDFLRPVFKSRIVATYPHDDDLTLYSNTLIVEKYGWEMIEQLLKQDIKFVRSHVLVAQETEKGERPVTFDQISQFNKVRFTPPDDLPVPIYPITTGIFAKAPHPNAAKLFVAFAISKEQQERIAGSGALAVRPDVAPPPGLQPLSSYRIADGYIDFIADDARTNSLRARFERYIGQPQGTYISTSPGSSR